MIQSDDFDSLGENVIIFSIPFLDKKKVMIQFQAVECEKDDVNLFSEKFKILLFQFDENDRIKLTDEFEAKFMDGKPFRYVENLSKSGIFAAVLNANLKDLEEKIRLARKVFEFC